MANHGDIPTNLTIGANQSVRRNAADDAFEAYTTTAGGSLWEADGLDNIKPKDEKKVDAMHLAGTVDGGLFHP